ncbi:RHS repeat protein [Chitinophaga sp. Cy-1792]|nr:RHS repeat protein [Chitinophaga sp. Cy-1792]
MSVFQNAHAQFIDAYTKSLNNRLPVTPEAGAIMRYQDIPVGLSSGIPSISVPLFELQENWIKIPISLNYHAGGIKVDDLASWTGLGWSLSAEYAITREVRGIPDEGSDGPGIFTTTLSPEYLSDSAAPDVKEYYSRMIWRGQYDSEPDMFYFSLPGASGKYVFDPKTKKFVGSPDNGFMVERRTDNTWVLTGPDGSVYTFDVKVLSTNKVKDLVETANYTSITSSWNLSKIVNPDKTDSILFTYRQTDYDYWMNGSNTVYTPLVPMSLQGPWQPNSNCFSYTKITGASILDAISSRNYKVVFNTDAVTRKDLNNGLSLNNIDIFSNKGGRLNRVVLNHSYFTSAGSNPNSAPDLGHNIFRLKLDGITIAGADGQDSTQRYRFVYDNDNVLPSRLSYSQDFWGYYNGASNWGTNKNTLAPEDELFYKTKFILLPGADRKPYTSCAQAGILKAIYYPTGGNVKFEYESNTVGYNYSKYIKPATIQQVQMLWDSKDNGEQLQGNYSTTFVINEPPSALNDWKGGAWVTGSTEPMCDKNMPYCPTVIIGGPIGFTFTNELSRTYFPNGTYSFSVNTSALNNWSGIDGQRYFAASLYYDMQDPDKKNFVVGGLRVKRIVTSDGAMQSPSSVKEYVYHDEVTDSSYGFLGSFPVFSEIVSAEVWADVNAGTRKENQIYYVRYGNVVNPIVTTQGAQVFYPKVTEYLIGNTRRIKQRHSFTMIPPENNYHFPYPPVYDEDWARGNALSDTLFQTKEGNSYAPISITTNDYDLYPLDQSGKSFVTSVWGLKYGCRDFLYNPYLTEEPMSPMVNGVASEKYLVPTGRYYKKTDTTITIDNIGIRQTNVRSYQYGEKSMLPVRVKTTNSQGQQVWEETVYPGDSTYSVSGITAADKARLLAANRVVVPLSQRKIVDNVVVNQSDYYYHLNAKLLLVDSLSTSNHGSLPDRQVYVPNYDASGNPQTIYKRDGQILSYLWDAAYNQPIASSSMKGDYPWLFTSFEYDQLPRNTTYNTSGIISVSTPFGKNAYQLNTQGISLQPLNSSIKYNIKVWLQNGAQCMVNGTPVSPLQVVNGNWRLHQLSITGVTQIVVTGSGLIDQLMIIPEGAAVTGNVYNASGQVTSKTDQSGKSSFFEYDNLGRLSTVRDPQGNILKQYRYQYNTNNPQ